MGRVQQLLREGKELPPNAAVDADGRPTNDPAKAKWLLPFGAHKGYGLALLNELYAAFIGGSLPTLRGRPDISPAGEKTSAAFFFHVIHPEAISAGAFALGRDQKANLRAVLADILGHGNESCMLPGQPEANAAKASDEAGGLIFTDAELREFDTLAESIGMTGWR
jgi:L-2-hydroxycarboxylate dehydrogenase (NAD+)